MYGVFCIATARNLGIWVESVAIAFNELSHGVILRSQILHDGPCSLRNDLFDTVYICVDKMPASRLDRAYGAELSFHQFYR
jgi:hypothetical protein